MKYVPPLGSVDSDAAYQNGNPSAGIPGSIVPAAAIEHPQRELLHVILKAGLTPDENTLTQLYEAIVKIVGVEVPLASVMEAGLVKIGDGLQIGEDGTLSVKSSDLLEDWRKSWIGVPRYWRSTVLPDDHCWANGDFISFSNWPELHAVYEAGGLEGMLLGWDATEEEQAANLGKWRPDSSIPTGLYTPALSGQFFRNWGPGDGGGAGTAGGNFSQWGPPDTSVAITNITFPYVAPKNGYVVFNVGVLGSDLDTEVFINGMRVYYETSHNPSSNGEQDIIPVAKGDTVTLRVAGSENPGLNDVRGKCYFLPCSFSYSSLSIPLILYLGRQA